MGTPSVSAPTFEHHREALGIGEAEPRISFEVSADQGWTQRAYELEIRTADETWSTGRVESGDSVLLPWPTSALGSRESATVRARVWGADGTPSAWSPPADVEVGLLDPEDWLALAISAVGDVAREATAPTLLRREFQIAGPVSRARLYVTAHGVHEVEINGARVGDDTLSPGWTSYSSRLRYQTYDVTALLQEGANAIGSWLADGWYCGRLGFHGGESNRYGERTALLAQLEVVLADGTRQVIATDTSWRSGTGPITASSLYDGEVYDARGEVTGWSRPAFDESEWAGVETVERDPATLVAPDGPPVRCTEERRPLSAWSTPAGTVLVDFGQNLVGRLRITVEGDSGETITLRHAEVLEHGELATRPLRGAAATDTYILAGDGVETWEPRFTFHGFRYAEISGWPGTDPVREVLAGVVARVYHTDLRRLGEFECSDPLVNRLHENVVWSMRGNFLDIPTDCPQRDERLGWTGDLQVFAPTAAFLYDCTGMLSSWLKDLAAEQLPDGNVPWYVPYIPTIPMWTPPEPSAVWGDAAVLTPWDLYVATGDQQVLARQYDSAKAWVELAASMTADDGAWDHGGYQLGDWLDPNAPPEDPIAALTDPYLVATAYLAHSARRLSEIAAVLGREEDQRRYVEVADRVRGGFRTRYLTDDGLMASDTQTAYALAIAFELLDEQGTATAGARLAELVRKAGNKIATGFAGTPLVTEALSRTGHIQAAYDLLLERECPSWLYAVDHGATTIWERWDSMLPDGTVNPGAMTSFNHYALGAVASWLHRRVAGISPAEPGYRVIDFCPNPHGPITSARASHHTPYGTASIRWEVIHDGAALHVDVVVPAGASGRIVLPGSELEVAAGRSQVTVDL
ncbi:family 78 glycoside hydrolase catalytic domain [Nocardioides sp. MAH-18]|uniref:alpha-L-rhamnosidase n=1 Tax=Nocardioides agri TaxID=2682843 RepID=A0A6L6XRP7_9ACTN|nr:MULTISPECIES: alpha-L-rhamnosidase [unclassified Nocardioides]MBA2954615.1 family 78 glycoside hydrolase catalytic domain [Nocardioides sp. CGMCC 1.13656]MVQ49472.1 family 78 glycoside hydrolase catalytic domain [Nocardioides sp. MAH-18]